MDRFYRESYANVHRGVYTIAEESHRARTKPRAPRSPRFVNAPHTDEIVFVRNATEAINLVAYTWARANLREGDVIVLSDMEHHANVVPWHILADERGVELRWIPLTADYRLDLVEPRRAARRRQAPRDQRDVQRARHDQRHPPARRRRARRRRARARRRVPGRARTSPVDVQAWDADFVAFTAHKMLGPTGIGALWARRELLEAMPPFLGGGEMIRDVPRTASPPTTCPWKFEAGTPPIAEAVGFGAAVDYLDALGMDAVREHEMRAHRLHPRRAATTASATTSRSTARSTPPCAAARSRSSSRASTPTTSRRSSTKRRCACAPATTAPSRSCACSASPPPPARRSTFTTTKPTPTRSSTRSAKAEKFFAF